MTHNKLLIAIGHAFLPLAVKVKQSSYPDRFHVEVLIGGGSVSDEVVSDELTAKAVAWTTSEMWIARLLPAFDAGVERGRLLALSDAEDGISDIDRDERYCEEIYNTSDDPDVIAAYEDACWASRPV